MPLDRCKKCGYRITLEHRYKIMRDEDAFWAEHIDCTDPTKGVAEKLATGKPYLGPKSGYIGH